MPSIITTTALLFSCIVLLFPSVSGSPGWDPREQIMSKTLFVNVVNVKELFGNNVTSTLARSDNTWVVNFYASWCGHCRRFAPTWKNLAYNIRGKKTTLCNTKSNIFLF